MSEIKSNYLAVCEKVDAACKKSGRDRSEVTLIAVSKTHPVSDIQEVYDLGCRDFGENKVQEILDKYDRLPDDIRWHMIGHLQTNKVKYIIDKVCMIHSVDSKKLVDTISKEAVKSGITMDILIEVNVAGEESKFGVSPAQAPELVEYACSSPGVRVCGLMTIAPYTVDAEENRQYFVELRQLCVDIIHESNHNRIGMDLSMGMTGDYMIAIEEGSTLIRVGTGIFGERNYSV